MNWKGQLSMQLPELFVSFPSPSLLSSLPPALPLFSPPFPPSSLPLFPLPPLSFFLICEWRNNWQPVIPAILHADAEGIKAWAVVRLCFKVKRSRKMTGEMGADRVLRGPMFNVWGQKQKKGEIVVRVSNNMSCCNVS